MLLLEAMAFIVPWSNVGSPESGMRLFRCVLYVLYRVICASIARQCSCMSEYAREVELGKLRGLRQVMSRGCPESNMSSRCQYEVSLDSRLLKLSLPKNAVHRLQPDIGRIWM